MTTKVKKRKAKKVLSEKEKLQNSHIREVRTLMSNVGFTRLLGVDGTHFVYMDRQSEFDDVFVLDNVILVCEYTIGDPGHHLQRKKIIYDRINENTTRFVSYLLSNNIFPSLNEYYEGLGTKYTCSQIQVKILYASYVAISDSDKKLVDDIVFFDYPIVQYFKAFARVVKYSAIYEFCEFVGVPYYKVGDNILRTSTDLTQSFCGNILPVEHSQYKEGYNIVSFYIDAESLLKRIYVLRNECWREDDGGAFYQRMVNDSKISSMRRYLATQKRVFVNNIIATISTEHASLLDDENNPIDITEDGLFQQSGGYTQITPVKIRIDDATNIIGIVDGQHRIYAYHKGDDVYEKDIAIMRKTQKLLVTAILYPRNESKEYRKQFEAKLFLEINKTQSKIKSSLQQEIERILEPFSTTSISKDVIAKLNVNGPLQGLLESHSYDKNKVKTTSIISYGLKPILKFENTEDSDGFFSIWPNPDKERLISNQGDRYSLKSEYVDYCASNIRELFIALKCIFPQEEWHVYEPKTGKGRLTITFVNGMLNLLRCLIKNQKSLYSKEQYQQKLKNLATDFDFRQYGGSRYRQMGEDIYTQYFC